MDPVDSLIWIVTTVRPFPKGKILGLYLSREAAQESVMPRMEALTEVYGEKIDFRDEVPIFNPIPIGDLETLYPMVEITLSRNGNLRSKCVRFLPYRTEGCQIRDWCRISGGGGNQILVTGPSLREAYSAGMQEIEKRRKEREKEKSLTLQENPVHFDPIPEEPLPDDDDEED